MPDYYLLERSVAATGYQYIELDNDPSQLPAQKCPSCGEELCLTADGPDAIYRISGRGVCGDLLTDGISILFSHRVRELLTTNPFRGVTLRNTPVQIIGADDLYYFVEVTAVTALLDEDASGVEIDKLTGCSACRVMSMKKIEKVVFQEKTLPDQEIFCCGNLFSEIVVRRTFVEFVSDKSLTNFRFISSEDFRYDYRN